MDIFTDGREGALQIESLSEDMPASMGVISALL
jgi:hypothetical protein